MTVEKSSHIFKLVFSSKQNTYNCNVTYTVKRPVMFIEKEKKNMKKSVNTY